MGRTATVVGCGLLLGAGVSTTLGAGAPPCSTTGGEWVDRVPVGMTTTPQEPAPDPEVVPSGDPSPIETPDPPATPQPGPDES